MDIIERALQTAAKAHEGQYRKGTSIPYITHPVAVGMMLLEAGYGREVVAAGILHDTVEDTSLSIKDIESSFGPRVAEMVAGASEPDKSLSWEERKEHTIQFLKKAPEEVRALVCADKLHNIRSIIDDLKKHGGAVWERFNRGKQQQAWYYQNMVKSLGEQSGFPLLDNLKREVNRVFNTPDCGKL